MPDKSNEQLHFDNMRQIDEYLRDAEKKIGGLYADTEMTQDADEARQLDVDRMELKEEEDYIKENLKDGHYIDGYEVTEIHKKYAKHIGSLEKELENEKDPAKVAEIEKNLNKLKESRNGELQRLCDEAPRYSRSAIRAMMTQQLRNNDAGRVGGEIKIYRKEEGHDGLLVTTYGKNRVGEFNKMLRKHDERVAELKGRKAGEQARNLGHSTKEFLQGDAEHMFKGSVSMGLHAALFLLNKLSQAGNKSAQWALYLYARNKLTMDDMEALQKAVDEVSEESLGKNKEGDVAEQKGWNGTIEPMDFNSPDLPPFADMEKCTTYDEEHDVLNVGTSYIDDNGTLRQGSVYLGSEENIRQHLNSMGELDVEAEIAENAAIVEALGIESLMVENVQEAYEEAEKEAAEKKSHEEAWEDECEEELDEAEEATEASEEDIEEVSEEEAAEIVLNPSDKTIWEEVEDESEAEEVSKEEVDPDDLYAFMEANNDAKGLVGDTPVQSGTEASNITKERGGDDYGDI